MATTSLMNAVVVLQSSLLLFLSGSSQDSPWRTFCGARDPFSPSPSITCPFASSCHQAPLASLHSPSHVSLSSRSLLFFSHSSPNFASLPTAWHGADNGTFAFLPSDPIISNTAEPHQISVGSPSVPPFFPPWAALLPVSPCLQHTVAILVSSFVLLAAISHALILTPLAPSSSSSAPSPPSFLRYVAFLSATLPAVAFLSLSLVELLALHGHLPHTWPSSLLPPHELAFSLSQGLCLAATAALLRVASSRERTEPLFASLRVWLLTSLAASASLALPAALRVAHHARHAFPSDFALLAALPAAAFLAAAALAGSLSFQRRAAASLADEEVVGATQPLLAGQPDAEGAQEEAEAPEPPLTPFASAGLLSTIVFAWVSPLLELGLQKPLQLSDVPRLRPEDSSDTNYEAFAGHWGRAKAQEEAQVASGKAGASPSVVLALVRTHWLYIALTALLVLVKTAVMYVGPLLLSSFVDYAAGVRSFPGEGPLLVLALLAAKLAESALDHQYYFRASLLGLRVQASLIGALFRKGLRLSNKAKQSHTIGEIVNYMSVDAQRLAGLMWELHNIWVLPLQIVVALLILYKVVGASMFAGLGVMLLIMLLNLAVSVGLQQFIAAIMAAKDKRMKATSEALSAMKVIKLYAWQALFQSRIQRLRDTEANWLAAFMGCGAVNIFLLWLSPLAVSVATFAAMVWLGRPLTPGSVFTAIATFRVLQEPLRSFPNVISSVLQSLVYLRRLRSFLNDEELQRDAVTRVPAGTVWGGAALPPVEEEGQPAAAANRGVAPRPAEAKGKAAAEGGQQGGEGGGAEAEPPLEKAEWAVVVQGGEFSWEAAKEGEKKEGGEEKGGKEEKAEGTKGEEQKDEAGSQGEGSSGSDGAKPSLSGISFAARRGMRVAVCGSVGAGKSSLLACLLGEMRRLRGAVAVAGSVAFVPQSAWIQNATVRDNILFGRPFEEARYREVLRCCCLEKDLRLLARGDRTQIGERGVNLSGGQKQRVQLARALYQAADVYLLDDPFSAVDAHTGTELFTEYVLKALAGRTVILVTHQVEFLPAVDLILVMRGGRIVQRGTYDALLQDLGADFTALVDAHHEALGSVAAASSAASSSGAAKADAAASNGEAAVSAPELSTEGAGDAAGAGVGKEEEAAGKAAGDAGSGPLVSDEEREAGRVGFHVYWAYLTHAMGGWHVPLLVLVQLLWQALQIGSDWWLAAYTSEASAPGPDPTTPVGFLWLYSLLALGSAAFVFLRTAVIAWAGVKTAQAFFRRMLAAVFRAPMAFFDATPVGRILSRASTNQATLDIDIPFICGSLLAMLFQLVGILFVAAFITWPVLYAIVPLVYFYVSYQEYYLASSRELSRLMGITEAPVIEHFNEALAGAAVIRSSGHLPRFCAKSARTVDDSNRVNLYYGVATSWLGFHLEFMGNLLLCFSALLLVLLPSSLLSPGLAGMSLSYGLALSQNLYYLISIWCSLETSMVATERILQFSDDNIPHEAPLVIPTNRPPQDWPSAGAVEFEDLQVRYRPDLPLVLRGVTLSVRGGAKCGIVGRTGSGKSTLAAALFRLVEPAAGRLSIDGVDCLALGLADLRSRLAIIPQEPTLFNGSVRYNLDPAEEHSDEEIWEALRKCQLADVVASNPDKLNASVVDGGENWSVGQRQLFCLGRALLRRARVLLLDEATASVDSATDAVIQRTIREAFSAATVLSIAHRIPTVMDSDTVVVMDQGKVAELDAPAKLLEDPASMFSLLVAEYAARSSDMADIAKSSSVENLAAAK